MNTSDRFLEDAPWISDQGDGTYLNPILHADYSDPDVIRVGEDFYMTASSFGHIPGLPILHSRDLVNWRLINHAIPRMDLDGYDKPQHGNGVWAPSLRYHGGKYWIFYGDPDVGIMMTTADHPAGPWAPLHLVKEGRGLIDTCPFWDEDGQAYLIHAYANSRAGIKHKLRLCRMSPDGRHLLDESQLVYDGTENHPTLEGPKLYKRNGYYYIFAPAGGVATGWQTVFRSRDIWGPYEDKIVLHQGETEINGPHQGGLVELESGESWFVHFQDKGAFGRVVHLQPVHWVDDWPLMGVRREGHEIGEPVVHYRKPNVGRAYPVEVPASSDEFDGAVLGLQWQWQANPERAWYSLEARASWLRLFAVPQGEGRSGLYDAPNLLLQKMVAPSSRITIAIDPSGLTKGDTAGLLVFGYRYCYLGLRCTEEGLLVLFLGSGNEQGEEELWSTQLKAEAPLCLRVEIREDASCVYSYSFDETEFHSVITSEPWIASEGKWVGAKAGIFCLGSGGGFADVDWFRVSQIVSP
ncbi:glycoside hydrolase 43 family protein [Paenibacillus whitsoniae]|uniref:Glycosyl hydrolase 43 family protein n=1 Tax=Paenibacillus whitsoniae TaxID=2496558 RepID=A0A430JI95_9BACL|nr:glycoside hydrolase 43 family protein [Paenibacillus whitsoniae]RTE10730.1 glycosyl hydrolase 43 family protein [Paenibacillus whitsoniae]